MVDVAIIGGGPAGFFTAISAAENNNGIDIDIYEKNDPLKTILRTGNGRCNLSNKIYDYRELASNYPRGEKFLYSIFSRFGVEDTINWFESHGLETYVQDDNRIFPGTNDANTVRNLLLNRASQLRINIKSHIQPTQIEKTNGKFKVYMGNKFKDYDKLVLSTGGNRTKSGVTGYDFARSFGHKITELKPSLTAFQTKETWPANLAGVSVKGAEIQAIYQNNEVAKSKGDFVFTHKGVSGPVIFKISSYCAFLDYDENRPVILNINFVPQITVNELEKDFLEELAKDSRKDIVNILKKYIPKSLATVLLSISPVNPETKSSQITKDDRKMIIELLTKSKLSVELSELGEEIVTAGGVELDKINPKTMESKIIDNLYFCGEILNIDGFTGGFNLQACWSTGYIAGINVTA